jgi:hypothetical protein
MSALGPKPAVSIRSKGSSAGNFIDPNYRKPVVDRRALTVLRG